MYSVNKPPVKALTRVCENTGERFWWEGSAEPQQSPFEAFDHLTIVTVIVSGPHA